MIMLGSDLVLAQSVRYLVQLIHTIYYLSQYHLHLEIFRLPAKKDPVPPLGNFADIVYLKEQSFLHRIRDVCTL